MTLSEHVQTLRAIDANANRATEALRVLEDHARFVRNHRSLAESLKQLRHELVDALRPIAEHQRLAARDTDRDVGTDIQTTTEYTRHNMQDVLVANWKRAQQALRSLEEFSKPFWTPVAIRCEQLRYQLYTLEKLARWDSELQTRIRAARLYVLCSGLAGERQFTARIAALVAAEVDVLQLREKRLSDRELLGRARRLRELTTGTRTLFIMNDRADLAALSEADGVHVGQDELLVQDARLLIGAEKLVGVSTHNRQQALAAEQHGADYIGFGPLFHSATKEFQQVVGVAALADVAAQIHIPLFAIGGISLPNVSSVLAAGASRIAVQNAIWEAHDPGSAAREFRAALS